MAMNLNMDVGQLVKNFLNKKKAKPDAGGAPAAAPSIAKEYYKQAALKCALVLCTAAIISWGINQLTTSSGRVDSEFTKLEDVDAAVVKMEQDIASSRDLLDKNRKKVEEILPMFSDTEGSKSLFKLISNIAAQNNLVIKNLSQGEVTEKTTPAKYMQTKVLLEMEGYYPNYIRFKNEINQQRPILRIESEDIKLSLGPNGERKIGINLNFIDYSVQKQEYEKVIQK